MFITNTIRKTLLPGLALMLILGSGGTTTDARTFTIDSYLATVQEHNKDLKLAGKEKDLAELQKKEAFSQALPSAGFETGYTRNLNDFYMYFDMSALDPSASGVVKAPVKRDNELSSNIAIQQTLYSPAVGSAIKASKQYDQLTGFVYDTTEQNVLTGARKVFYSCLFLEKVLDIANAAEVNARENYDMTKLKFDNGQVSEFALLQAETRWRSTIPDIQQAERNLKLALNSLKNLAGIDIGEDIDIEGSLDTRPAMPEQIAITSVFDARPDFQALNWEKELRKTNLEANRNAYKPKVTGTLAYAYSAQSNKMEIAEENNLWFVGVNLSIPLYTGGYLDAQVEKARVDLKKTDLKIDQQKETISTDIVNAWLRCDEAQKRIESADATRKTAKRAFEIAEISAREGLATQLQLKDARFGYDQATIAYYSAVYDYITACFDWELAVGNAGL